MLTDEQLRGIEERCKAGRLDPRGDNGERFAAMAFDDVPELVKAVRELKESLVIEQASTGRYHIALSYALQVIESYEMDIRNWHDGQLLDEGFCQGTIYKTARAHIAGILHSEGE